LTKALTTLRLKKLVPVFAHLKHSPPPTKECWPLVSALARANPILISFLKLKEQRVALPRSLVLVKQLQVVVQRVLGEVWGRLKHCPRVKAFDVDAEIVANQAQVLRSLESSLFNANLEMLQLKKANSCWNCLNSFERRMRSNLGVWRTNVLWTGEPAEAQQELFDYLRVLEAKVQLES
jgi:hypothetical protein